MSNKSEAWSASWESDANNFTFKTPLFKFSKQSKQGYSENILDVWYKLPYKYVVMIKCSCTEELNGEQVTASLILLHSDGSKIDAGDDGLCAISSTIGTITTRTEECSIELPFHFNVSSHKYNNNTFKFELRFERVMKERTVTICTLISRSFYIKSKKPIIQPGIRITKRLNEMEHRKHNKRTFFEFVESGTTEQTIELPNEAHARSGEKISELVEAAKRAIFKPDNNESSNKNAVAPVTSFQVHNPVIDPNTSQYSLNNNLTLGDDVYLKYGRKK